MCKGYKTLGPKWVSLTNFKSDRAWLIQLLFICGLGEFLSLNKPHFQGGFRDKKNTFPSKKKHFNL
jgi:hypothetical protein